MNFQELSQRLRALRRERGITQQTMAADLHIARATLNAFETGRAHDIGLKKVILMLDYLGMELCLREQGPLPTFEELRDAH